MTAARVAWWVRTDLRLHDNLALQAALDLKPEVLYPIWTWDPHYVFHTRVSPNRWRFLLDCMADLSESIKQRTNSSNGLLILRGRPEACIRQILQDWNITHIVFEKDTDTYALQRDRCVQSLAESMGVQVILKQSGRTLYDPEELTKLNGGKAIYNIRTVQKVGPESGPIPRPINAPEKIPSAGYTKMSLSRDPDVETMPDLNQNSRQSGTEAVTCYSGMSGPGGTFAVPTMEELNMKPAPGPHRGGETEALRSLAAYMNDKKKTALFEKPKTNPVMLNAKDYTERSLIICRESFYRQRQRYYLLIYTLDLCRYESSTGMLWTWSRRTAPGLASLLHR